jgi:hypothetical protein
MKFVWRATNVLMSEVRSDLQRPHPFADERVGFFTARAAVGHDHVLLIADEYFPVAEENYVPDHRVGVRISQEAIRTALDLALLKRAGVFHVHMHLFPTQRLWFSGIDLADQDQLIPDFLSVRPEMPHGALVLSPTSGAGRVWTSRTESNVIQEFNEIGARLRVIRAADRGDTPYTV